MTNLQNKKILLVNAPFMDFEVEIQKELERRGADVTFLPTPTSKDNPFNRRSNGKSYNEKNISRYLNKKRDKWTSILNSEKYSGSFDYVLVLKCLEFHPIFTEIIRRRNPDVKIFLYLYDTVQGGFQIDRFFRYYDNVYSFDGEDCKKYGLNYLPIFWIQDEYDVDIKYDIFGYGNSVGGRYAIFKKIKDIAHESGLRENIHLYGAMFTFTGAIKYVVKRLLKDENQGRLEDLKNGFFQTFFYTPLEFRKMIMESNVTLDTVIPGQNGLTARFMWALGANKKIITNNVSVKENAFYSPEQIFLIDNNYDKIVEFVQSPYIPDLKMLEEINKYRIDNWINTIFEDEKNSCK